MTSKCTPPSLPWSTSVLVEYSPVANERDPDPGGDHAEDQADDGDDDRDVGLVAAVGRALGPAAEDPAGDRGGKGQEEEQAGAEDEQAEATRAEDQRPDGLGVLGLRARPRRPRPAAGRRRATRAAAPAASAYGSGGRNSDCTAGMMAGTSHRRRARNAGCGACDDRGRVDGRPADAAGRRPAPGLGARVRGSARARRPARLQRGLRRALPPPLAAALTGRRGSSCTTRPLPRTSPRRRSWPPCARSTASIAAGRSARGCIGSSSTAPSTTPARASCGARWPTRASSRRSFDRADGARRRRRRGAGRAAARPARGHRHAPPARLHAGRDRLGARTAARDGQLAAAPGAGRAAGRGGAVSSLRDRLGARRSPTPTAPRLGRGRWWRTPTARAPARGAGRGGEGGCWRLALAAVLRRGGGRGRGRAAALGAPCPR